MGTERGADRLANFNDAVVAIAITLLVLPLTDAASQIGSQNTDAFVKSLDGEFIAFAVSFVVISSFWRAQHALLENLRGHSDALVSATLLWMFAIVFLPFPTALLSSVEGTDPVVHGLYIGTMLVASIAMWLERMTISKNPQLVEGDLGSAYTPRAGLMMVVIMALAFVLAVTVPSVGLWPLLLLALQRPLRSRFPVLRG